MRRPLIIRRVVGHSMLPALRDSQIVLASGWLNPRIGRVVVINMDGRECVKRVGSIAGNELSVFGDNLLHSRDSRQVGPVSASEVLGSVIVSIPLVSADPL